MRKNFLINNLLNLLNMCMSSILYVIIILKDFKKVLKIIIKTFM